MAGEWIKMRGNLWDDPRVGRLCDLTDQGEAAIVGGLYWLWAMADQHTEDGLIDGLTLRQIDRKTGISGFGDALVVVGWISVDGDSVLISKFEEHNGSSAKKRMQTARRVANHNLANASKPAQTLGTNAVSVSEALVERELEKKKRREEKNTNTERATQFREAGGDGGQAFGSADPARADFSEFPEGGAGSGDRCAGQAAGPLGCAVASAGLASAAADAMRSVGLDGVSASHPTLRSVVSQGITVAELRDAALAAVASAKGFPWALARAAGQRRDAAAVVGLPDAPGAVDPDSRSAIEADSVAFGFGRWEQVDRATGQTMAWPEFARRVKVERSKRSGVSA